MKRDKLEKAKPVEGGHVSDDELKTLLMVLRDAPPKHGGHHTHHGSNKSHDQHHR